MIAKTAPTRQIVDCGDLPFIIKRDGTWLYRGSPITRKPMVCLFSTVLKREEDGSYLLETPAERGQDRGRGCALRRGGAGMVRPWAGSSFVLPHQCRPMHHGGAGASYPDQA